MILSSKKNKYLSSIQNRKTQSQSLTVGISAVISPWYLKQKISIFFSFIMMLIPLVIPIGSIFLLLPEFQENSNSLFSIMVKQDGLLVQELVFAVKLIISGKDQDKIYSVNPILKYLLKMTLIKILILFPFSSNSLLIKRQTFLITFLIHIQIY